MLRVFEKQMVNGKEILIRAPKRARRGSRASHRAYTVRVGSREFTVDSAYSLTFTVYETPAGQGLMAISNKLGEFSSLAEALSFCASQT